MLDFIALIALCIDMSPAHSVCDLRYASLPDLDEQESVTATHGQEDRGSQERSHQERRNSLPSELDQYESNGWFMCDTFTFFSFAYCGSFISQKTCLKHFFAFDGASTFCNIFGNGNFLRIKCNY